MEPSQKRHKSTEQQASARSSVGPARTQMRDLKSVLNFMFTEPKRLEGRIKWFDKAKSFGKIIPKRTSDEIFVHRNDVEGGIDGSHYAALAPGVLVTYELGKQDDGKPCATKVKCEGFALIKQTGMEEAADAKSVARDAEYRSLLLNRLHVGTHQELGKGKVIMEDAFVIGSGRELGMLGTSKRSATCAFFGVFDGHGGASCSNFVALNMERNIFEFVREQKKRDTSSEMVMRSCLTAGFKTTEHNFFQYANKLDGGATKAWANSGTTACTITLFGPDDDGRLKAIVANAGDSRAVLGKKDGLAVRLSTDHKPDLLSEKKRIESVGGTVAQFGGTWRVILKAGRSQVASGLSVTRSLGDHEFKLPVEVVSPVPELSSYIIDLDDDIFIVLASDGIWTSVADNEAIRLVSSVLREGGQDSAKQAAKALVELAHSREASDDKTAVVVWLGGTPSSEAASAAPLATVKDSIDFMKLSTDSVHAVGSGPTHAVASVREAGDMFEAGSDPSELALLDDIFSSYAADMGISENDSTGSTQTGHLTSQDAAPLGSSKAKQKTLSSKAAKKVF